MPLPALPERAAPVRQVVQRVVGRHLLGAARLEAAEGYGGSVTLVQCSGPAPKLNIQWLSLVLDGMGRCAPDGLPAFVETGVPVDDKLHVLRHTRSGFMECCRRTPSRASW